MDIPMLSLGLYLTGLVILILVMCKITYSASVKGGKEVDTSEVGVSKEILMHSWDSYSVEEGSVTFITFELTELVRQLNGKDIAYIK